ncbi:MAG: hypothetical protein RL651_655 [Pseudomonadota bacterium]|jgi:SAM-dependent methyltransferase
MGFTLDKVVPWGRSFDEYVRMFDLSETDLQRSILGCGDGPAAFNAMLSKAGGEVVSFDPIYVFTSIQIQDRVKETYEAVMDQIRLNQESYLWDVIPSVHDLGRIRMSAMDCFFADYEVGKIEGRYIAGELPTLPFANKSFDLALSSHFLFLYSDHLTMEFHSQSLQEMLRVVNEVRVFPILKLDGQLSQYVNTIIMNLKEQGFFAEIKYVPYEFQRGGNQMLVIKSTAGRG